MPGRTDWHSDNVRQRLDAERDGYGEMSPSSNLPHAVSIVAKPSATPIWVDRRHSAQALLALREECYYRFTFSVSISKKVVTVMEELLQLTASSAVRLWGAVLEKGRLFLEIVCARPFQAERTLQRLVADSVVASFNLVAAGERIPRYRLEQELAPHRRR